MVKNKPLHFLGFESPNKSTAQDSLANSVVMNTRLLDRSTANDAYAQSVSFNMRCDGTSGSFYFYDDCGNLSNNRLNYNAVISSTNTRGDRSVIDFPGNTWVQFPHNQDYEFGTGDFTIEMWLMFSSVASAYQSIIALRNSINYSPWAVSLYQTNVLAFEVATSPAMSAFTRFYSNYAPTVGTWFHLAIVRSGNSILFFINGVLDSSNIFSDQVYYSASHPLVMGGTNNGANYFNGSIQDIRITKGIARYTGAFTPPSAIPAITPIGSPKIVDDVMGDCWTNVNVKYQATGGPFNGPCLYFNGAAYLETQSNSSLDIFDGSTPSTFELWFKPDKFSAADGGGLRYATLISNSGTSSAANIFNWLLVGNTTTTGLGFLFEMSDLTSGSVTSWLYNIKARLAPGSWYHLALTREHSYGPIKMYLNGKQIDLPDSQTNRIFQQVVNNTIRLGMSQQTSNNRYFIGWMADIRVTRKCRYFGEFTPATLEVSSGEEWVYETSLLMHLNDNGKNPVYGLTNDYRNHTMTVSGTPLLQAQSPFSIGASAVFNGTSDYITTTYDSRFDLSTGDWTIEYWVRPGSISTNQVHVSLRNPTTSGIIFYQYTPNQNKIQLWCGDSSTTSWEVALTGITPLIIDQWYHVAATRTGNVFQLFVNGILQGSVTWAGTIYINSANLLIGANSTPSDYFTGSIDDVRITKGFSRYYSASAGLTEFLPITNLLHFNAPNNNVYFADEIGNAVTVIGDTKHSNTQAKFGTTSAYFDGNGDRLTFTYTTLQNNWTIDAWVYAQSGASWQTIFYFKMASGTDVEVAIHNNTSLDVYYAGTVITTPFSLNTWHHVQLIRTSYMWQLFLDGVPVPSAYFTITDYPNGTLGLGYNIRSSIEPLTGYMDEVRFVNGTAYNIPLTVQSAAFPDSAPTDPYFSNVSLLLHGETLVDSSSYAHTVTAYGDAAVSSGDKMFGSKSIYFDGTGDYLAIDSSGSEFLMTGDFTFEFWFKSSNLSSGFIFSNPALTYGVNASLYLNGSYHACPIGAGIAGTWQNFVLMRSGSTVYVFYNGCILDSWTFASNVDFRNLYFGFYQPNANNYFTGYIDEVRLTKGVARYSVSGFAVPTAPYASTLYENNLKLSMHFEGANSGTTFIDAIGHSLTAIGATVTSTTQKKYGNSSLFIGDANSGNALTYATASDPDFQLTGDFTIECWFYQTANSSDYNYASLVSKCDTTARGTAASTSFEIGISYSGGVGVYTPVINAFTTNVSSYSFTTGNQTTSLNTWNHVAVTRSGNTLYLFVNKILSGSTTVSGSCAVSTAPLRIGSSYNSGFSGTAVHSLRGYIDDVRIYNGSCKYDINSLAPPLSYPAAPLPIGASDANWANTSFLASFDPMDYFVDELGHYFGSKGFVVLSGTQSKFGAKSAYFGGMGVLTTSHRDDLHLPGDFTIEGWIYPEVTNVDQWILTKAEASGGSYPCYAVKMLAAGTIQFTTYSANAVGSNIFAATFGSPTASAWNHFAVVRFKDKWYGYLNGVGTLLATSATNPYNNTTNGLAIGSDWAGTQGRGFTGYIDELRILKGVAKYQANFSVPTKEFDWTGFGDPIGMAYPGFHCHYNGSTFVDECGAALTASGNAVISTAQSQFGGTSGYFDGNGDFYSIPWSSNFDFGAGDFTIETWFYPQVIATSCLISLRDANTGYGVEVFLASDGSMLAQTTTLSIQSSASVVSINNWYHVAFTRVGTAGKLYLNGTQIASGTIGYTSPSSITSYVGKSTSSNNYYFTGYIDETRVTKGFNRYPKAFTPSTTPFPDTAGDPYWDKVIFALPLVGPNGSTAFYDRGPFNYAITNSNVTYASTDIRRFGSSQGTAASFNGTSARLTFTPSGRPFHAGLNWTVEGWLYSSASGASRQILDIDAASSIIGHCFSKNASNKLTAVLGKLSAPSTGFTLNGATTVTDSVWHHFAFTKRDRTVRVFLDGVLDGTLYLTEELNVPISATAAYVGSTYAGGEYWSGYLQDLRVTTECKYIASFTPPQMPLGYFKGAPALSCRFEGADDGVIFMDDIGNALTTNGSAVTSIDAFKFGTTSGYFTGSSDYLTVSNGLANFNWGDNDFSIDCWVKTASNSGGIGYIYNQQQSGAAIWIRFGDSGVNHALQACVGDTTLDILTTSLTKTDFSSGFRHIQLSKRYKSFVVYVDGVAVGTKEMVYDINQKSTNLLLLHCNGTNGSTTFTDSSPFARTVTANGNAQISTAQSKFGSASALFDGTGDYLSLTLTNSFAFGYYDFTLECWFRLTALDLTNGNALIVIGGAAGSRMIDMTTYITYGNEVIGVALTTDGTNMLSLFGVTPLQINTWYHAAIVRYRNTLTLYLNGVVERTIPYSLTLYTSPSTITIGRTGANTNADFNGYIDEVRISSVARYTAAFTPQVAAFDETVADNTFFTTPSSVQIGGLNGYIDTLQVWAGDLPTPRTAAIPAARIPQNSLSIIDTGIDMQAVLQNRGVTQSTLAMKVGTTGGYFDGKYSSVRYKMTNDDWLDDADFTIEFWYYAFDNPPSGSVRGILTYRTSTANYTPIMLQKTNTGILNLCMQTAGGNNWETAITSLAGVPVFEWHHIAISRYAGTVRLFLDGQIQGSLAKSNISQLNYSGYFIFGSDADNSATVMSHFGYLDSFQYLKGFAKYTKGFVPPLLTAVEPVDFYAYLNRLVPSSSLFFYKMDDTINTVLSDFYGNSPLTIDVSNNISIQQTALSPLDVTQAEYSVLFNGGKGTGSLTKVLNASGGLIFSFFIKTSASTGTVFSKDSSFDIQINQGKLVVTAYYSSGTYQITSPSPINDNQSHLVMISLNTTEVCLFIDYTQVGLLDIGNIAGTNNQIEMPFNYSDTNVIFQLRGGEWQCDLMQDSQNFDNTAVILTNDGPFGKSVFFNTTNHIEIPNFNLSSVKSLSGQYARNVLNCTIEFWVKVYQTPTTLMPLLSMGASGSGSGSTTTLRSGISFFINTANVLEIRAGNLSQSNASTWYDKQTPTALALNTWYHFAITINSWNLSIYQDGILQSLVYNNAGSYPHGSLVNSQIFTTDPLNIGGYNFNKGALGGGQSSSTLGSGIGLADVRISRGILYTTNFTRPNSALVALTDAPLLSLVPNSNQAFGNLTVNMGSKKINKTNLKLNGTSDYLIVADTDLMLGTFTLDCWVWFKVVNTEQVIVSQSEASLSIKSQKLTITNGTEVAGSTTINANQWYHVAIVRTGTTAKVYLNGTLEITHSSFNDPSRGQMQIGARAGATFMNGILDAFRVRNAEVWTDNFTAPVMTDYIPDPYWDDVTLLIRGDTQSIVSDALASKVAFQHRFIGYDATASGSTIDDVGNWGTIMVGNAAFGVPNFRGGLINIAFDGINDAVVVPNTTPMRLGTTFTIEFWVYLIDFAAKRTLLDKREDTTNGLYIYVDTDAKIYVKAGDSTAGFDVTITSSVISAGWRHVALVRNAANSDSWMLFVDGTQAGSTANSNIALADNTNLYIGRNKDSGEYFYGGLTELIVTTTAKYTGAFSYPTVAALDPMAIENDQTILLLHFDGTNGSETFVDSSRYNWQVSTAYSTKLSSTQAKFGATSAYFDGTEGRGILVEPNPIFALDEDDFTIDFWAYITATGTLRPIISCWSSQYFTTQATTMWQFDQSAANTIQFYYSPYSSASALLTSGSTFSANQWIHIAVTRKNHFFTLFINGAISATTTMGRTSIKGARHRGDRWKSYGVTLGNYYDSSTPPKYVTSAPTYTGYIDELRIVRGKAMWERAFTAPVAAYSLSGTYPVRDTNVKLFVDPNAAGTIIDKTYNNTLTLEGSIFGGTIRGTAYGNFDGTGDAIRLTSIAGDVACGLDPFCIESWVYPINGGYVAQTYGRLFETEQLATSNGICMVMNNSGTTNPCSVVLWDSKSGGSEFKCDTVTTLSNATWSHVAFTREGLATTSWLNGVPKQKTFTDACFTADRSDGSFTLSNNNKTVTCATVNVWKTIVSRSYFDSQTTTGVYFEGICTSAIQAFWGIVPVSFITYTGTYPGQAALSYGYYSVNGNKYTSSGATAYGNSYVANDVIGVAVKNGKIWFAKNGVWQASGNPVTEANPAYSGITGLYSAALGRYNATSVDTLRTQVSEFSYAPPAGFLALRDADLGYYCAKSRISMGANNSALESFYGYLSNTRFTQGDTRYKIAWSQKALAGDSQSNNVVLLLNLNSDYTDSSNSAKTVTNNNATIDTSVKRFGAGSAAFNGTTAYLTTADSADWNFGTGDFTIEMWAKSSNYPFGNATDTTNSRWLITQQSDANNYIELVLTKTGATFEVKSGGSALVTVTLAAYLDVLNWHHYAVVRSGNTFSIFFDGLSVASATANITMPDLSAPLEIGRWGTSGGYFAGWIDDVRITKGYARYPTETTTVQVPLALQPFAQKRFQSPAGGVLQPTMLHTSAGKFDLASSHFAADYFTPTAGTHDFIIDRYYDLTFNYRDFTIEGWFNPSTTGATRMYFQRGINSATGLSVGVSKDNLDFRFPSVTTLNASVNITTWAHVAFQRRGTLKQIFLNGTKVAEASVVTTDISDYDLQTYLGGYGSASDPFRYYGSVDGFRVTRGVARYTGTFTPPSTQFPTKYITPANTRLNLFFDDLTKLPSNVFRVGGTISKSSSVNEKGAVFFDGDEDFIGLSECISKEDFTLEFWFEPHDTGSPTLPIYLWSQMIGPTDTTGAGLALVSGKLQLQIANVFTDLTDLSLYTWYHFALTRQNGTLRAFVNGIKLYEASVPVLSPGVQALGIVVDTITSPNESRYKGFLKNYRLIKNVAQYTSNFTPATTLAGYSENSSQLLDSSRSITVGDFIGNLDDVSLKTGMIPDTTVQNLYYLSQNYVWSASRTSSILPIVSLTQKNHVYHNGTGSIWGTVTDSNGNPMKRKLVLIEYWSYMPIAETVSNPTTGYYEFTQLDTLSYFSVIAEDSLDYRYNDILRAKVRAVVR